MGRLNAAMALAVSMLSLLACAPAAQWYIGDAEEPAGSGAQPGADAGLEALPAPEPSLAGAEPVDPLKQKVIVLPFRDLSKHKGPWDIQTELARGLADSLRKYEFLHVIPVDSGLEHLSEEEREGEFGKGRAIELARLVGADVCVMAEIEALTMSRQNIGVPLGGYRSYKGISVINAFLINAVDGRLMGEAHGDVAVDNRRTGIINPALHVPLDREYYTLGEAPWGSEEFHHTLTGKAVDQCLRDLATELSKLVRPTPEFDTSDPKIIEIDGSLAYINVGSAQAVKNGDKFGVYDQGRLLKDPVTGVVLGNALPRRVGVVQIEQVLNDKLSAVRILDGAEQMAKGFTIRAE